MSSSSSPVPSPSLSNLTPPPHPLTLQVDFAWSSFRNTISLKSASGHLTPLIIQHFRATKPQLRFDLVATDSSTTASKPTTSFATSIINNVSIDASCTIHGRNIALKPLKRLATKYNYLSHTLSPSSPAPVAVTWIGTMNSKAWDFVCLESTTQLPIAKLSASWWTLHQVSTIEFEKEVSDEARDEVVITGLTVLYVMMTRMNNPLSLLGAAITKTGKVDGDAKGRGVELGDWAAEERNGGKAKRL